MHTATLISLIAASFAAFVAAAPVAVAQVNLDLLTVPHPVPVEDAQTIPCLTGFDGSAQMCQIIEQINMANAAALARKADEIKDGMSE
ncbi:hypothetical protein EDC01DRAFT_775427 [Geopyxis carbonaria]|nr:hypothetical protein EDC01DRAFT_775427 [Geopyxis carbonaria]